MIGAGYVGLVVSSCFANAGHNVLCVDTDKAKISDLNRGNLMIFEPGLHELIRENLISGNLCFTADIVVAVQSSDIIIICVGTPSALNGEVDMSDVLNAASQVGQYMLSPKIIVNKSTVPIGATTMVCQEIDATLRSRSVNIKYQVCSNPEFLREGNAVEDFLNPDRIIIGTSDEKVKDTLSKLYRSVTALSANLIFMDEQSAEMTKYAANAMLALRISFINEVANIAELVGANIESVKTGVGADHRIGNYFLAAGCGYGGSCFPKDVKALTNIAEKRGYKASIINSIEEVNVRQKKLLFDKLNKALTYHLPGRIVAIWGLSFKPETDDIREAPSITLIEKILQAGGRIRAFDPVANMNVREKFKGSSEITFHETPHDAAQGASAVVICTEWECLRKFELSALPSIMKTPIVVDGRNMFDLSTAQRAGVEYHSIGRQMVNSNV